MINAELAAKAINLRSKAVIEKHVPAEYQADLLIDFNCECADPDCKDRVPLSLKSYDILHRDKAHFIIVKGHNEPIVEKIHKEYEDLAVVEKYALK